MSIDFLDMARTGPETITGRYLRSYWQPIYVSGQLAVNSAKPVRVLGEDFTVYRGESGEAYAVASRCAHRNTQLSTGWVRGENIRCLYHGWAYDGDGQCVEQPAEPEPFCDKVRIRAYPVQEYLGLIFAYMGEGEPPPLPRYEELEAAEWAKAYVTVEDNANWLNRFDQLTDVVHPFYAHPQIMRGYVGDVPLVRTEDTEFGLSTIAYYRDGTQQPAHLFMPNAVMFGGGRSDLKSISWLMPVDDEHCRVYGVSQRPQVVADAEAGSVIPELGEAILRGDLTVDEIMTHPGAVSIQDYVVLVGQGDVYQRAPERLGREDAGLIASRKLWLRELAAFAEGETPKTWHVAGAVGPVYIPPPAATPA